MNVQTQSQALDTPAGIANFPASFGATVGQNGCTGICPAMQAVMMAPTVGIAPYTFSFMVTLIAIVTSGSTKASTVTSRLLGQTDVAVFNSDARLDLEGEDPSRPADPRSLAPRVA